MGHLVLIESFVISALWWFFLLLVPKQGQMVPGQNIVSITTKIKTSFNKLLYSNQTLKGHTALLLLKTSLQIIKVCLKSFLFIREYFDIHIASLKCI